jgi:hypothetical protein
MPCSGYHPSMHTLKIVALETDVAHSARHNSQGIFGNPIERSTPDEGGAPCRHCLRRSKPGEAVLLFSHSPFFAPSPYKEVGPIFVHADECDRFDGSAFPEDFKTSKIVLRGYGERNEIREAALVDGEVAGRAAAMLEDPDIAYLHARFALAGCFACRIERNS